MTGIALQVKPEDAVSNLSLWLHFFGVDRVPNFLATTQADTWGTAISLAIATTSFTFLFVRWRKPRPDREFGILDERVSANATSPQPARWQPLHKALHYLVYDSEWAMGQLTPADADNFDRIVGDEFKEHLARGEIAARGKAGLSSAAKTPRTTQPIPADYWVTAFIQPNAEILLADDTRGATVRPHENGYVGVVVDWEAVQRTWPKRRQNNGLSPLAILCEPERRKLELEK